MLGQREKIIVIHLKSVLDFDFEVIQGQLMTRFMSYWLNEVTIMMLSPNMCHQNLRHHERSKWYHQQSNQDRWEDSILVLLGSLKSIAWIRWMTHYIWLTSICIMKTNFGNTSKKNPHTYHQRNLHIFPI